jgi:predicted DNA-binding transcriptional regulator AlpA
MGEPLLIDAKAARATLGIGERRLWELTNCDAIPCRRIGRSVRYCPRELAAWVAAGCPCEPGATKRVREGVRA